MFTKAVLLQENTPVNFSKPKNGIKYDFYLLLFWLLNHPLDFQFLLYPEVISFEEPNSVHVSMCAHGSDNIGDHLLPFFFPCMDKVTHRKGKKKK